MMRASRTFFRFFGYSLLLIILYVFQGSGFIISEIFGGRPLMLISLALCIASFENTLPSVIFGALCGVLTDISFDGSIGYFAFALTIVCYAENFVFSKYFVPSFVTVIVFSFAAVMTVMFTIAGMQQFQRQTTASHSAMTKLFQPRTGSVNETSRRCRARFVAHSSQGFAGEELGFDFYGYCAVYGALLELYA